MVEVRRPGGHKTTHFGGDFPDADAFTRMSGDQHRLAVRRNHERDYGTPAPARSISLASPQPMLNRGRSGVHGPLLQAFVQAMRRCSPGLNLQHGLFYAVGSCHGSNGAIRSMRRRRTWSEQFAIPPVLPISPFAGTLWIRTAAARTAPPAFCEALCECVASSRLSMSPDGGAIMLLLPG
jgi:hypothetical protein